MNTGDHREFADLLLQSIRIHEAGDSQRAVEIIDQFLENSEQESPENVREALGFRVEFADAVESEDADAAAVRHLEFCRTQSESWTHSAGYAAGFLALRRFGLGDEEGGLLAADECIRHAEAISHTSQTIEEVVEAVRRARAKVEHGGDPLP